MDKIIVMLLHKNFKIEKIWMLYYGATYEKAQIYSLYPN